MARSIKRANASLVRPRAGGRGAQLVRADAGGPAQLVSARVSNADAPQIRSVRGASGGGDKPFVGNANQLVQNNWDKHGGWALVDASGNVVKKYTRGEAASVMRRGHAGASLNDADAQAFWRATGGMTEDEKKAQAAEEARNADAAEWNRRQAIKRQQELEDAKAARERQDKLIADRNAREDAALAEEERRKREAADERAEAWNSRWGVDAGTRLSETEMRGIERGDLKWGRDPQAQKDIDDARSEIERAKTAGELSDDDYQKAMEDLGRRESSIGKRIMRNTEQKSAEQVYNNAFVAPDGSRYTADENGRLTLVPTAKTETPKPTAEETAAVKTEDARKKYILGQIEAARKDWQERKAKFDSGESDIEDPGDFNPQSVIDTATSNWNSVYNPQPTATQPTVTQPTATQTQGAPAATPATPPPAPGVADWRKTLGW